MKICLLQHLVGRKDILHLRHQHARHEVTELLLQMGLRQPLRLRDNSMWHPLHLYSTVHRRPMVL